MTSSKDKSDSTTTVYLGNTRTVSDENVYEYCSKFGLVLDCSRRLLSSEQAYLVDFTFVQFLNRQSSSKFISTSSHILNNGIHLDVRPFSDILYTTVPLHVDRKICIRNASSALSMSDIKKYLRTFGAVKQVNVQINENEQKYIYIEFESAASRNKLLRGKIRHHRVREHILDIMPLLRPTDVDLYKTDDKNRDISNDSTSVDDTSAMIYLEHEYNIKIRERFSLINDEIADLIKQTHHSYEQLRKLIQ